MLIVIPCATALRWRETSLTSHEHYLILQYGTDTLSIIGAVKKWRRDASYVSYPQGR